MRLAPTLYFSRLVRPSRCTFVGDLLDKVSGDAVSALLCIAVLLSSVPLYILVYDSAYRRRLRPLRVAVLSSAFVYPFLHLGMLGSSVEPYSTDTVFPAPSSIP